MEFTEHFIDEVLRMWPPRPQHLERIAKVDVQIGPYKIPKGTLVGSSLVACMNNPKYYENPEIFDPYRWTKPGGYKTDPHSFIPFSAGPRSCIGKYLALLEVKILIIYFLNNFNLERTEVPLRTHVKLLYEPYDDNLVRLTQGGMQIK